MKKIFASLLSIFIMSILCVPVLASNTVINERSKTYQNQFTDVPEASWCAEYVRTVYEYGLMDGVSDARFHPNGTLSTAAALAIACRLHNLYQGRNTSFAMGDPWYQPYVDYALSNEIIGAEAAYSYDAPITRANFALFISNALSNVKLQKINNIEYDDIPDVTSTQPLYAAILALEDVGVLSMADGYEMSILALLGGGNHFAQELVSSPADECYEPIYRLYRAGILTGNDAYGTFTPKASITRVSAAAILSRVVEPSQRKRITLQEKPIELVPVEQLANRVSLQKKLNKAELTQAYEAAKKIVEPLANLSREAQLGGIMVALRAITNNEITYSSSAPHYSDAYGFFVLHTASCAGCTRATGLCLNMLGIPYEHVNENQYSHQWTRVNLNGTYWICDAYGLYCGPEEAPYQHPNT